MHHLDMLYHLLEEAHGLVESTDTQMCHFAVDLLTICAGTHWQHGSRELLSYGLFTQDKFVVTSGFCVNFVRAFFLLSHERPTIDIVMTVK